jgi:hypothetical protein
MQSRAARLGALAVVIVAAVVVLIVLANNNSDEGSSDAGKVEVLSVDASGNPVGGVKTLTYNKGDQIQLEVKLARPEEEIHVHGYDKEAPADKSPVRLTFPASLDGSFEIEVHHPDGTEAEIAHLRVNP